MANQYTYSTKETQRDQVLRVVRELKLCTTPQIRDVLGLGLDRIGMVLTRLRIDGMVEREKTPGERCAKWAPTCRTGEPGEDQIVVITVSWSDLVVVRDPLIAALFGSARHQEGKPA